MHWSEKRWAKHARELGGFLEPMIETLGRTERRVGATRYVQGLLMPGERKSIEPLAARLGVDAQSLQQFVRDSPWSAEAVWSSVRREAIASFAPLGAWIVDETSWPKQGQCSVGVAHQYCGAVGKQANCQVCVEVAVSDGEVALPVAGQLYLPESWTKDRERCRAAGVPDDVSFQTKPQIALRLLRQVVADGVAAAPVLGDQVYGDGYEFRAGLRELKLEYCLQVNGPSLKAWAQVPALEHKLRRSYLAPGTASSRTLRELADGIAPADWVKASWKAADGSTRRTRLAWRPVWLAHGLRYPEGELEEAWLLVDWPAGDADPYHCYLMHLHRAPTKAWCLRLSRGRWHIEQYFLRGKDDLGLDHYEGRSWQGFHHHLVLAALAYLFVGVCHHRSKKNFWPDVGERTPGAASVAGEINRLLHLLRGEV
jgi:SRSO17 transposase